MLKIALESLGCSKNLVDAEIMMGILNNKGYKLIGDFEEADVIIVNTCGFIESA
ncbi:30S ribosomal protein S12 methylthiotransferase RimO, partial [Clostridioides difficile]